MIHETSAADALADLPERIGDAVLHWAARAPGRPALVEGGEVWTYGELARVIAAARLWLVESGVRPGDRVMIVNENSRAAAALVLAAADLGAWAVSASARLAAPELAAIRAHCGARRVIYATRASAAAKAHAARDGAAQADAPGLGEVAVGALDPAARPEPVEPDSARQVAVLLYTSGTTGEPKGVMLTHRNLLFMARTTARIRALGPDDRFYGVLPLSHIVGLTVVLLGTLMHGGAVHLVPRFSPAAALAALARERLTVMLGVPAMYALLADYAQARGLEAVERPALRLMGTCGAPLDPAIKQAAERLFGLPLTNGYGITECSPTIAQTRAEEPRADCSVGRVLPGVEVKLTAPGGAPVAPGEVGELQVRGSGVMKGYYRAPDATAAAIDAEGWFNSRDLARFEDGNLFIVGRTKELIIRFGFNVYPPEIEAALNAHPGVVQSAVVGRPAGGDEEVVAFVQPVAGATVTERELMEHLSRHLASYKRPSEIIFIAAMPSTATGKIRKSELAARAAAMAAHAS